MTEADFYNRKIKPKLKTIPNSWFTRVESKVLRGIPDIMGCVGPVFVALELKKSRAEAEKPGGRIALQKKNVDDINRIGGIAFIVYPENWDEVFKQLILLGDLSCQEKKGLARLQSRAGKTMTS